MYKLQVGSESKRGTWEWRDISPSHGEPYAFESYEEAHAFLDWLYPTVVYDKDVRVVSVDDE